MCTVDERDRLRLSQSADAVQFLSVLPKFGPVTALKLGPALGIVAEPLPQFRTRGNILYPIIESRFRFAHPARPKPVDEDPYAVVARSRLVSALQPKMRGRKRRPCDAGVSCSKATSARRLSRSRPTVARASRLSLRQ